MCGTDKMSVDCYGDQRGECEQAAAAGKRENEQRRQQQWNMNKTSIQRSAFVRPLPESVRRRCSAFADSTHAHLRRALSSWRLCVCVCRAAFSTAAAAAAHRLLASLAALAGAGPGTGIDWPACLSTFCVCVEPTLTLPLAPRSVCLPNFGTHALAGQSAEYEKSSSKMRQMHGKNTHTIFRCALCCI